MPPLVILLVLLSTILHASWNLILGSRRDTFTMLRTGLVIALVGGGPVLFLEVWQPAFSWTVWGLLIITGLFQTAYALGLTKGYQSGRFTVVYPIARALPILVVACVDVIQGHWPTGLAWAGMVLVLAGCLLVPLESPRSLRLSTYWNPAMFWVGVTAAGTIGYTVADDLAAQNMAAGADIAARYGVVELALAALFFGLVLKAMGLPTGDALGWSSWRWAVLGAVGIFGAYWLILWSYQLTTQTSYVVALRQFSIVLGVAIGVFLFKEPAPKVRVGAALMIAAGIAGISIGG